MGIVADGMSCYPAHYNSASCKHAHQIKLKPQPATAVQHWMKRAWSQRIRGWGMSNLGYGEKPMFHHLCCFVTLLIFHLPLLTSLMLQLVVGGVIAEVVVVVAGLSAPYPHPHSTHVCPFFSLTHSSLVSSHSPRFWSVGSSRTSFGGIFGLTQVFFLFPTSCWSTHTL